MANLRKKRLISFILVGLMLIMNLQIGVFASDSGSSGGTSAAGSEIIIDVTTPVSVSDSVNVKKGAYWLLKDDTTEKCMVFENGVNGISATYSFTVSAEQAGAYTLNIGAMSWASDAKIGVQFDAEATATQHKVAMENSAVRYERLPVTVARNFVLTEGTHTLVISEANSRKLFVDSLTLKKAETYLSGDETVVSALTYNNASNRGADSDKTAVAEQNYYGVNYNRCALIGQQNGVWAEYKVIATAETVGRYILGARLGSWTDSAGVQASVGETVIGSVKAQNVGETGYDTNQNYLPLKTVGSVVLAEGENVIKITNTSNYHAFLQELVLTKPVINVNGTTTISALEYSDATPYDGSANGVKVENHWKTKENYMLFNGSGKNEINYKINVADGKGGRYRVKATAWSWNPSYHKLNMIADSVDSFVCGNNVGSDSTVNVDVAQRVFPLIDMGNIYLASGEHILNFYGSGCHGLYIKDITLEYVENENYVSEIPAEGAEISALNYASKSDSVTQSYNWSGKSKLSMKFNGGSNGAKNTLIYNLNVAVAGQYNIGIKAMSWQPLEPYTKIWVDGKMRGYIQAQDDISSSQVDVVTFYVRSTELSAGSHVIMLESDWGCDTFIESVSVKPVGASDAAPSAVAYSRAENALDGYAEGIVTITPPASFDGKIAAYHLYWGNASGKLENYSAFGYVLADKDDQTKAVTYAIPKGVMIPQGATKILAYIAKQTEPDYSSLGKEYHISENVLELNAYASTEIGATAVSLNEDDRLFSIAVLSDQHVMDSAEHAYSVNTGYAFNDIIATRPDTLAVLSGGDNIDDGNNEEQYKTLKGFYDATLGTKNIPYYLTAGNHDKTGGAPGSGTGYGVTESGATVPRDLFKKYANEFAKTELITDANKLYWSKKVGNVYLISLASETNVAYYYPSAEQLNWLEAQLDKAEAEGATAFVFCHQPIKNTVAGSITARRKDSGAEANEIDPNVESRFKNMIADHPNAILFSGHSHVKADSLDSAYTFDGDSYARYFNVPNTGVRYGGHERQEVILASDDEANLKLTGEDIKNRTWDYYVNYYTNMPEGFYIDVYPDYVVLRGRSFDTFEWLGGAQYLIPTNYYPISAIKSDNNTLVISENKNYNNATQYDIYVAMYNSNELADVKTFKKSDFVNEKITVDLSNYGGCMVRVFAWKEDLSPIMNSIDFE